MEWKKYHAEDGYLSLSSVLAVFLLIASFYLKSWEVFLASILFLLIIFANTYYMKLLGEKLSLRNPKVRYKLFAGQEAKWILEFENKGLPILKGELRVLFGDSISPMDQNLESRLGNFELSIPFSLNHNERKKITIPFSAMKRGVSKIRKLELYIPNFIGFGETILEYRAQLLQDALVYPSRLPVKNTLPLLTDRPGTFLSAYSLFDENLSPAGTRQYVSSDSFNRINWKASARKQCLQTKVFDKAAETGWNISLNVSAGHSISAQLEECISSAAEIAFICVKENIPFSICINIRTAGSTPFYYLPAASGKDHLQKVLEMLALVDNHSSVYPYEKMLSFYERHLTHQPFFVHAGELKQAAVSSINNISRKGSFLFELHLLNEEADLRPLQVKAKEVAVR
ncbi:DUF58 domain-containing protein [Cytobacillus sp.]|uniref:DUF58 domain-containing protein n=1 Tax=Cytobacillus sp. TaxID=2675269 RepID=UPI003511D3E8